MATKRISALTAASSAALTDQIPIEDNTNATKRLTLTQVFALTASSGWSWAGTHAFGAAVTMATTLGVTGAVTLASTLSAQATTLASLSVTGDAGVGGNFAVNTNKVTMAAATGNTAIAGTLAATGAATLGSTLAVTGASTLTGAVAMASTLGVTGIATLGAAAPTVYTSYAVGGRTEYTSTSSTRANAAFEAVANPASSSSGIFTGAWGYAETKSGNAQNLTASVTAPGLIGVRGQATHAGSGTVTAATSLFAGAIANSGGGTLTNAYGLVIAAQTAGTNNYGVYQVGASTNNYFQGKTGIGAIPSGTYNLEVTGTSYFSGRMTFNNAIDARNPPTVPNDWGFGSRLVSTASTTITTFIGETVANPAASSGGAYHGGMFYAETDAACLQNFTSAIAGLRGSYHRVKHNGSGIVTGAAGIMVDSVANSGGGTITNTFGVYIAAQTAGTSNWGVYQLGTTTPNMFAGPLTLGSAAGPIIKSGSGSPEGVVTAPVSSIYLRTNGTAGSLLYQKQTGTGNTGWTAIA